MTRLPFALLLTMTGTVTSTVSFNVQLVEAPRLQVTSGLLAAVVSQAAENNNNIRKVRFHHMKL